ncbi:cytokine-like nuclear factor N-PAC isoform X2 [Argiope bruennichi]|uniref:Cytokine-like nuclear factor N-PAC n=1 Tax=Argiope bruennichi TaxID=94029 RepID=A0A8T0FN98_ARGBR|nr:cytokine-like nuclear factor N-PAC isoform X2 [Argiope bruennichi]XP_055928874.1 cytokine-like nuclear factor N-PAC isoform X2 [Argiope bruennichi]KAF8791059.1 putative oxidoreductase GLYR1 like protein [Argiope bruennichi]
MAAKKDFSIGDLVWAKMKCFPFWPAKIVEPPTNAKSTSRKARHYVFFFGSENYAWIQDKFIVHHSEEMLQCASSKKKSAHLIIAIEKMAEETPKQAKSLLKEKESPEKSPEASTSGTQNKIAKVQREEGKTESQKVRKKVVPKRRAMDESEYDRTSPPQKLSKRPTEDFSELINKTPNNPMAVIRQLDEHPLPPTPPPPPIYTFSEITLRNNFDHQQDPTFDIDASNKALYAKEVQAMDKKIGFIGLGMMGKRFVKNLLDSRHKVTVWNRTPEKCVPFINIGAEFAQTPSDLVEKCDIIFCCVSGPEASKSVVFGSYGIVTGLEKSQPGSKCYVEMTTLDPTTSIDIGKAITYKGGRYLEAPFRGSRKTAEDGSLVILAAGDIYLFNTCSSCIHAMAKLGYFLGSEVGLASKMNLAVSSFIGVSSVALAEAMALVKCCNLSQAIFLDILGCSGMCSRLLMEKGEAIMSRFFETNISLNYQQRHMTLALSLDNDRGPMSVTTAANEVFKRAKLRNYSDHDVSAVCMGTEY